MHQALVAGLEPGSFVTRSPRRCGERLRGRRLTAQLLEQATRNDPAERGKSAAARPRAIIEKLMSRWSTVAFTVSAIDADR
jgi:hypothetical protein